MKRRDGGRQAKEKRKMNENKKIEADNEEESGNKINVERREREISVELFFVRL